MSATRGLTENLQVDRKPRTVCVYARPELQVFPLDQWRDIRRNNVENHWNVFLELKKEDPP